VSLRNRLEKLEATVEEEHVSIELHDGSVVHFPKEDFPGTVFDHESRRWKRYAPGEDPGPAHPVVEALREARNLPELVAQYGTCLALFVGQDRKMREAREAREKS
jgi:hypothetical protein